MTSHLRRFNLARLTPSAVVVTALAAAVGCGAPAAKETSSAAADTGSNCHDECILPNPISGGCGKYVKVCVPGPPDTWISQIGKDLRTGRATVEGAAISVSHDVGNALADVADSLPQISLSPTDVFCGAMGTLAVVNGAMCVVDPTLPGLVPMNYGGVDASNACAEAALTAGTYLKNCAGGGSDHRAMTNLLQSDAFGAQIAAGGAHDHAVAGAAAVASKVGGGTPLQSVVPMSVPRTFVKGGNNGTVSCSAFCRGSSWGGIASTGLCVGGTQTDTAQPIGCESTPGLLSTGELQCTCVQGEVKTGNNGTVTCDTYCAGSQWGGFAGVCAEGALYGGASIGCGTVAGDGAQVACSCVH